MHRSCPDRVCTEWSPGHRHQSLHLRTCFNRSTEYLYLYMAFMKVFRLNSPLKYIQIPGNKQPFPNMSIYASTYSNYSTPPQGHKSLLLIEIHTSVCVCIYMYKSRLGIFLKIGKIICF